MVKPLIDILLLSRETRPAPRQPRQGRTAGEAGEKGGRVLNTPPYTCNQCRAPFRVEPPHECAEHLECPDCGLSYWTGTRTDNEAVTGVWPHPDSDELMTAARYLRDVWKPGNHVHADILMAAVTSVIKAVNAAEGKSS